MSNLLQKQSNHAEKIRHIGELKLGERRYGLPETHQDRVVGVPPDNTRDGYIIGGGVATFTENVTGQVKRDILNATSLAQLAATKKYDREWSTEDWYREYNRVLGIVGFVMEGFEFDGYSASGSTLSMDEAVLEIIGSLATGN